MTTQVVPAVRAVTPEEVAAYRRDGWVKLDGLLPLELVQELLAVAHRARGRAADNPAYNGPAPRHAAPTAPTAPWTSWRRTRPSWRSTRSRRRCTCTSAMSRCTMR